MGDSYLNGTMHKHWANTMTTIVVYTLSCPFICTNGSEIAVQEPPILKEYFTLLLYPLLSGGTLIHPYRSQCQGAYFLLLILEVLLQEVSLHSLPPSPPSPPPPSHFQKVFDRSDLPGGVVNIVTGSRDHLTKYLTEHQDVEAMW